MLKLALMSKDADNIVKVGRPLVRGDDDTGTGDGVCRAADTGRARP